MKISILGLGWFGYPLAQQLKEKHQIAGTTRDPSKAQLLNAQGIRTEILTCDSLPSLEVMDADAAVLNIPPVVNQLEWMKRWRWKKETHLIFISSTSVYGRNQGLVTEETDPLPDSATAQLLLAEENWVKTFPHYSIIRFGGLMGKDRHPGKHLSGKTDLPGGSEPVNLIHLDDCVGFTALVIEKKIFGTFNLVSPEHPSRRDYYQSYCQKKGLPLPQFLENMAAGKIVSSDKVKSFYEFKGKI